MHLAKSGDVSAFVFVTCLISRSFFEELANKSLYSLLFLLFKLFFTHLRLDDQTLVTSTKPLIILWCAISNGSLTLFKLEISFQATQIIA